MHKIKAGLLRLGLLFLLVMPAGLTSCDKVIYDYEGDCSVHYVVNFRYDYNIKWADAFAHEVECITLYVIDSNGNIVLKQSDEGVALGVEGYQMEFVVDPGTYTIIAWGGTKNKNSFTMYDGGVMTDMTCTMNCSRDASGELYIDSELDRLFYGRLDDVVLGDEGGVTYENTISLMKDTNSVQVVLQHISGDVVEADKFSYIITSNNWEMGWDNSVISDEELTYYAFYVAQGEAEMRSGTKASFSAAIADFTISRMMFGEDMRLTIYNKEKEEIVLSIPLLDILVMVRSYYNAELEEQEYLDRQDDYSLVFFLDEGERWVDAYIYINSWMVVLQDAGL